MFQLGNLNVSELIEHNWCIMHMVYIQTKNPGCYGNQSIENIGIKYVRERSGSVVECLTRDRGAAGSSFTGVTVLWSLSKTHLS